MLCTNGHNVPDNVAFCTTCGTSTFRPAPMQYRSYVAAPAKSTNGLAVASMILGIVWIFWLGSLLALIFGLIASKQITERGQSGKGMAIAGIILGIVGILILVFVIIVSVAVTHTPSPT